MRKELILLVKIMGCICSKGVSSNDYVHNDNHVRDAETRSSKKLAAAPLRKDDGAIVGETDGVSSDATTRLISHGLVEENTGSTAAVAWENGPKTELFNNNLTMPKLERRSSMSSGGNRGHQQAKVSRIVSIPNGVEAAHTAAGWPSWLTSVAAEAISGWVPRRAESFEKLEKIGQGTYSSVYKARDLDSGKIVAMKKVRFMNMDPESVRFMAREIHILRKLDHPNVMKLECLVTSRVSGSLYLVFEYMEHDLAGLAARPGVKFTEPQIKCFLQQLFCGLEHCHSRGVLHRDIKGSNLLIDSNGNLKIGDFGLATFFRSNQRNPLTSRVVTLWYRPPELLLGSTDYGVSVDLWSAGCILAELFNGKPIMPGRTEVEQLHKIFKLCGSPSEEYWKKSRLPHATIFKPQHPYRRCLPDTFKDFPSSALALLDVLLAVEPEHRGSASTALQSEFFTANPLPCDPSSLPKYPPSKEFDARRRDEEARRNRAASGKSNTQELVRKDGRPSRAVPAPNANAELQVSIQKRFGLTHAKANSEKFNQEEDGGSGFPIAPPRALTQNGLSHSGPLAPSGPFVPSRALNDKEDEALLGPNQASVSSTIGEPRTFGRHGSRGSSRLSRFAGSGGSQAGTNGEDGICNQLGGGALLEKSDWSNHLPERPQSSNKKDNVVPGKGYAAADRIHCSGPLLHAGVNMDDLLKDNEKQIQQAFRKARSDMTKIKRHNGDNRQTESLLHH